MLANGVLELVVRGILGTRFAGEGNRLVAVLEVVGLSVDGDGSRVFVGSGDGCRENFLVLGETSLSGRVQR